MASLCLGGVYRELYETQFRRALDDAEERGERGERTSDAARERGVARREGSRNIDRDFDCDIDEGFARDERRFGFAEEVEEIGIRE